MQSFKILNNEIVETCQLLNSFENPKLLNSIIIKTTYKDKKTFIKTSNLK